MVRVAVSRTHAPPDRRVLRGHCVRALRFRLQGAELQVCRVDGYGQGRAAVPLCVRAAYGSAPGGAPCARPSQGEVLDGDGESVGSASAEWVVRVAVDGLAHGPAPGAAHLSSGRAY